MRLYLAGGWGINKLYSQSWWKVEERKLVWSVIHNFWLSRSRIGIPMQLLPTTEIPITHYNTWAMCRLDLWKIYRNPSSGCFVISNIICKYTKKYLPIFFISLNIQGFSYFGLRSLCLKIGGTWVQKSDVVKYKSDFKKQFQRHNGPRVLSL